MFKKGMKMTPSKKFRLMFIAFILVFSTIIIIDLTVDIAKVASGSSTVYVGGSGPGNYTKIQWAIENASYGDTVFVHAGTYNENVNVNKALSLVGEDKENTIIDGGDSGYVVHAVFTNWFNITGFTIRGSGSSLVDSGIALSYVDNGRIENNIVVSNYNGIHLSNSDYINITNNDLSSNDDHTISLVSSSNNSIYNNKVTNNDHGIRLSDSSDNNIIGNDVSSNNFNGILLSESSNITLTNNIVNQNDGNGIKLDDSSNNIIAYNNVTNSGYFGIHLRLSSKNNRFHHNYILNNFDQVFIETPTSFGNIWDDGNGEGNYWSDYDGHDDGSNGRVPDDGVGDTEVPHPFSNQGDGYFQLDNYPLILTSEIPPISEDEGEGESVIPNLGLLGLSAISALLICIIASLYSLTEGGKYKLVGLMIPLYTRIKKDQVLNHYLRGRINGYIEANPGEHYNAIKYALNINNGALTYHLRVLERENVIVSKRDGMYKRFYPKNVKIPKNYRRLSDVQKRIVKTINEFEGITQTEIANKLDISPQVVNYHVKILESGGIVRSEFGEKYRSKCYIKDKAIFDAAMEMGFPSPQDITSDLV
jgi:parallel beta-helix repeat protein